MIFEIRVKQVEQDRNYMYNRGGMNIAKAVPGEGGH
jgi:hypothetical protein